ncbi:hypothetical protein SMICM17S_12594 [Streptomyces microflavus]
MASYERPELVITLWLLFAAQKAITLGMAAFAGAMILYQSVMIIATIATAGWAVALNATGIVPIIRAIVLVVGLLVAAVIYAYKNWDWFRVTVDAVAARAIKTAALWIWDNGLKPAFNGIWTAMKAVGAAAVWLWDVEYPQPARIRLQVGKDPGHGPRGRVPPACIPGVQGAGSYRDVALGEGDRTGVREDRS